MSSPRRRAPRKLGESLERVVAARAPQTLLAEVQAAWPRIGGEGIAQNSEPVAEKNGRVTVACSGGAWAQELELIGDELLARLAETLGEGRVEKLRFTADLARHR